MKITSISLKNWMNFQKLEDVQMSSISYIIGPNSCGKSNFLDALRFLHDVARSSGGGLQKAVEERGGFTSIRSAMTGRNPVVSICITLEDSKRHHNWTYELSFKQPTGNNVQVVSEKVIKDHRTILSRPQGKVKEHASLKEQTHLEQTVVNQKFRELVNYFDSITYLHLVPQLLKHADSIGGSEIVSDPFGQGFLKSVAKLQEKDKAACDNRLKKIASSLKTAIPNFEDLRFKREKLSNKPHLETKFKNWRANGEWQKEHQMSDGTLRLIGILWTLQSENSLLLLEEPELSLHPSIIQRIPEMLARSIRGTSHQIFITTHSDTLLSSSTIGTESVIRLAPATKVSNGKTPRNQGTVFKPLSKDEENMLASGFSIGETLIISTT